MPDRPLVSVTMPVYNGEKFIGETIESVLNQTYKNFELIIVNDASTDGTKEKILSYSDPRIFLYENPVNSGIVSTRNNCLNYAKGKYVAVLDSDDLSSPDRLEKQVKFLESNSDHGLCGSHFIIIDSNGIISSRNIVPLSFSEIDTFLIFNNCFLHSSIMVRRDLITAFRYTEGYDIIEDYELYYRLAKVTKFANIPIFTTKYRLHGKNQTIEKLDVMLSLRKKMDERILNDFNIPFTTEELNLHSNFMNSNFSKFNNNIELLKLEKWLLKIYALLNKEKYNGKILSTIIIKRWILLFYSSRRLSMRMFNSAIFWNFKAHYIKCMQELVYDRLRKRFRVI